MISVVSQRDLRAIRDLSFCHVCGLEIHSSDQTDHDHIPPQSCFDKSDRNPPLKLRAHVHCNNANKLNDEKVGELIAAQRYRSLNPAKTHLGIQLIHEPSLERSFATFQNLDVRGAIRRWVGGFHAALYRNPLKPGTSFQVTPPLPSATINDNVATMESIPAHHAHFVETLKLNRAAKNVDVLITSNGKLRYECVWAQEDAGPRWFCIFALDLYDWITLGDIHNFEPRGCVGGYMLNDVQVPASASRATRIQAAVPNKSPLDPFGD